MKLLYEFGVIMAVTFLGEICHPHYTDGIRSVDWFVRYNDGHIGRPVYYPEYQDS